MRAKDVLLRALEEFSGSVVFVSHDRYFIDKLATRVFEIEDGEVRVFPGNYEDYLWRKESGGSLPDLRAGTPQAASESPAAAPAEPPAKERRLNPIKLRQMRERHSAIEEEVARLEAEIEGFEKKLADFESVERTRELTERAAARRADLEKLLAEWEELGQALEAGG
jgi:ATP-binding cassette, subfamily F, member 3